MDNQRKHFVYMLECKDGSLYTGYTTDVNKRLRQHEEGKGAKYTRGRGPFTLVYVASFLTKTEAMQEEHRLKQLPRHKKLQVIETGKGDECGTATSL
ncbi:GIY-YIG nuclease family protein [Texcoconibacillus texcoconensis]|nr:GIY-YIG nuclease family protein [Texcoconibacillus texcoconensis]